jgi:nitric oxide reductase subunit B
MILVDVGLWNSLGAGIFGCLIRQQIISDYEIGTAMRANHGHAAMMGVYGMLAVGLALFCLRYLIPAERWPERAAKTSFWSLNIGLAWMCFSDLLPLGFIQLYESVGNSYFHARSLDFLTNSTNTLLEWLRFPGDVLFIVGGVLPLLYICWIGVRHRVKQETLEEPEDILFTEITEPVGEGEVLL